MSRWLDETIVRLEYDALWSSYDDSERFVVCISERDTSVLVSCLRYALWSSRWYGSSGNRLRDEGRNTDLEIALTWAENLKARLIMACDLSEQLSDIASAIRSIKPCCPGQAQYVSDGEGGYWYGTEQPIARPDTFGEGEEFATLTEFQEQLCSAANNIVSGLIATLNNASIATLLSLTGGAVVVGVFVASPPIALVLALIAAGFATVGFRLMADYIHDNRQDWVCAIFNSDGYADFLVRVDTLVSDMTIELDIAAFDVSITGLIHSMLSTDVFNNAYQAVGLPPIIDPVNCAPCVEVPGCINFEYQWGSLVDIEDLGDGQWRFVLESELDTSLNYHRAVVRVLDPVNCAFDVLSAGPTISVGTWGTRAYNGVNFSGTLVNEALPITSEEYATKLTDVVTVFIQNNPGSPSAFTVEYVLMAHSHDE